MPNILLKSEHLKILQNIFQEYSPNITVWAYGSRVKGDAHSGSDLDLVTSNLQNEKINIADLKEILQEINIPFLIDIFELHKLPKSFQDEVERSKVEIYPKLERECGVNYE